jgi:hypothetical protein
MGKPEDQEKTGLDPEALDEERTEEDAEGHMFMPRDTGTAHSLAGDREREVERHLRDRELERQARAGKHGRPNR